jgi:hypothetical protein
MILEIFVKLIYSAPLISSKVLVIVRRTIFDIKLDEISLNDLS